MKYENSVDQDGFFSQKRKTLLPIATSWIQQTVKKKLYYYQHPKRLLPLGREKEKKCGDYTWEVRAKRARYANKNCDCASFFKETWHKLEWKYNPRFEVGLWKKENLQVATDITRLRKSPRRCPLELSDMDHKVCEYKESHVLQAVLSIPEFT